MLANWVNFIDYMYFRLLLRYNSPAAVGFTCCILPESDMIIWSNRAANAANRTFKFVGATVCQIRQRLNVTSWPCMEHFPLQGHAI